MISLSHRQLFLLASHGHIIPQRAGKENRRICTNGDTNDQGQNEELGGLAAEKEQRDQ